MSVIHTNAVIVQPFHRDVFTATRTANTAQQTMAKKLTALLLSKYGEPLIGKDDANFGRPCAAGGPTYEQYRNDQAALKLVAEEKGLTDNQWVRKPYAAAVKALYGALPVAMTPEALKKRAEREAQEAAKKEAEQAAAKAGAPKGQTTERVPSPEETLEQLIARIGVFQALDACVRILASEKQTKAQAQHIAAMVKKAKADAQQPIAKKAA